MKQLLPVILCFALCPLVHAQYYLRGQVCDEKGIPLPNVKIWLYSKGTYPYNSGSSGSFGIPSPFAVDTITLQLAGYETYKGAVATKTFQRLQLKMLPANAGAYKHALLSAIKSNGENRPLYQQNGESYSNLIENPFVPTTHFPETRFSLNIDRASYSNIRRFLNMDYEVPPGAVRIEEMLNYFDFGPADSLTDIQQFTCRSTITAAPWQKDRQLLFLHLQAPRLDLTNVPPSNLVFLIDASGSMDKPNRLPLLQAALHLLTENLRPIDTVSIVVYGGNVGILLPPTSGAEKQKIREAIDLPTANGSTPGASAIRLAYQVAASAFIPQGNNRVILATDGDFNIGQSSEKELEELIARQRRSGIFLTCLGLGMGNYKDSKLEALAKTGNGNFAYLDNLKEAEKVLVAEFTKTMYAVATDAVLHVRFNPQLVKAYRLIGFDNREDALQDSTSEIDGGEIGSGHSLVALFEIDPNEQHNQPDADSDVITVGRYASVKLQYRLPEQPAGIIRNFTVPFVYTPPAAIDSTLRLATAVAMFGELLRQSRYATNYSWSDVLQQVPFCKTGGSLVQQEFYGLVEKAQKIYTGGSKKEKKAKKQRSSPL